jgi:hypothetical protein
VDQKLTDLSELTSPAVGDETYIVDTSDTTHDVSGTSKRITLQSLLTWLQSLTGWNASKLQSKDIDDTAPTDNQVLTYDDASSKWKPAPAGTASPLTTKGDLYGYDTTNQRIPVGDNGQVLTADDTEDLGVAWKAIGSESKVISEIPTGDIDGSNKDFVLANTPFTGTLKVYLNGVRQKVTDDYTLATATISFVTAPTSDSKILCDYDLNVAASGNADTLDGKHGAEYATISGTETLTGKTLTTPVINNATFTGGGALISKIITATRDIAGASADVSYTGVGFRPTAIICIAVSNSSYPFSIGMVDSNRTSGQIEHYENTTNSFFSNTSFIELTTGGGNTQLATVKSYDSDGFTLTWVKSGSPTGTGVLTFLCFK